MMAGGSGERFWPLSRRKRPKQLLRLTDSQRSLLSEAILRVEPLFGADHIYLSTTRELEPLLKGEGKPVLAEPAKRNTAGAIAWSIAQLVAELGDDLSIAILTSDQAVRPGQALRASITSALETAEATGKLGTIGIRPTRPATGFGYVEVDTEIPIGSSGAKSVKRFIEKPNEETAARMASSDRFLWNSGMFFWTAAAFRQALAHHSPPHSAAFDQILKATRAGDAGAAEKAFLGLPDISIDYALMERAKDVFVVEATFEWDDLGSWDALGRRDGADGSNIEVGDTTLLDTSNCVVWSETGQKVCALGVEDLVLVVTEDAILLIPKSRSQDVRKVLAEVRETNPELT